MTLYVYKLDKRLCEFTVTECEVELNKSNPGSLEPRGYYESDSELYAHKDKIPVRAVDEQLVLEILCNIYFLSTKRDEEYARSVIRKYIQEEAIPFLENKGRPGKENRERWLGEYRRALEIL